MAITGEQTLRNSTFLRPVKPVYIFLHNCMKMYIENLRALRGIKTLNFQLLFSTFAHLWWFFLFAVEPRWETKEYKMITVGKTIYLSEIWDKLYREIQENKKVEQPEFYAADCFHLDVNMYLLYCLVKVCFLLFF